MGNIKEIFKILLVIQIICSVFASYGHPDAETIDFGLDPSRDQLTIEAAIRRGMDGDAVAELLRTKQPVVKTVTSPSGVTKTTTYRLDDDGSISSKTVTQSRKSYTYNSGSIPDTLPIDDLRNSPSGTVTRTFTDENGHKVTQTISVDKPKPTTVLDTDDLTGDWINKEFPRWHHEEPSTPFHRTITRTFTGPNGERRRVQSWTSDPDFKEPHATVTSSQYPPSNYHTVTRTFIGPNGEKRVVQTTSSDPDDINFSQPKPPTFSSINTDSWPGFDFSPVSQPWGSPNTDTEDSDDWTVVEGNSDVETSTKKKFETWTPKTWNWPEFPTFTTTTTAKPKIFIESELHTPKPLPNLDDFLKSQYGPSTTSKTQHSTTTVKATTTSKTPSNTPKSVITPTTKKPVHINLEDLPVTQIFHNGKPADEGVLKNLPPHLKPNNPDFFKTENVFKIDNKHPIEEDVEVFSPKEKTSITTIKKTHTGPERPTIKDLDPQMQEILKNAGISPEDITNIDGDTITKTRTEPDGRKITTIYKVQTVPVTNTYKESTPVLHKTPVAATNHKENKPKVTMYTPYKPLDIPQVPSLTPLSAKFSPISEFLAKLGLTKSDISSQHGRVTKTFIDDDGQVLTASFVLSSPMSKRSVPELKDKPIK